MKKQKIIIIFSFLILIIAIALLFAVDKEKLSDYSIKDESAKIADAKQYGDKIVGWLRVEGTNIDLPLVETSNSTNVLRDEYDFAWTNSFPDEKSNHPSFVSHNIRNVSPNPIVGDDEMTHFEQLMSFIYLDFIKDNQFIEYTNERGETSLYRIYAVALIKDDQSASYSDTFTKDELDSYIKDSKDVSMYDINTEVDSDDLLLSLYTCTRFYGTEDYSFRVDARKLRKNEKTTLSRVKSNENYDKIESRLKEGEGNEKV